VFWALAIIPASIPSPVLLPPPLNFTSPGCPSRSAPPAFVVWELAGAALCQVLLLCSTVMTTFPFLCPLSTYL
jgi:hypothetical protein